jgi:DNA-binding response OmpR family regulator
MGVKDYIVKPFKGEQLIERAKNILKLMPVE